MQPDNYKILLSFDTEEFDVPRERGVNIPLCEAVAVSAAGTRVILDTLKRYDVKATFFCTTNFAENAPDLMRRIVDEGHEVASHGCDHWQPADGDLITSKSRLESIVGKTVSGYRQPRMFPVQEEVMAVSGYLYNSSLNPTFIPGKYQHLNAPRRPFLQNGVLQVPTSVTPLLRFPLFWFSYHHLPAALYRAMVRRTLRHDGYFATYFHPWEFVNTGAYPQFKLSYLHNHNAGIPMLNRLDSLIKDLKTMGAEFTTFTPFSNQIISEFA